MDGVVRSVQPRDKKVNERLVLQCILYHAA